MAQLAYAGLAIACLCSPAFGEAADTIKPGISLTSAEATLSKFGYDVDQRKVSLDMLARDRGNDLHFSPLGDHIVLVIEYQRATKEIVTMSAIVISEHMPKSKDCRHQSKVLEAKFENDGVYWLKFQRAGK